MSHQMPFQSILQDSTPSHNIPPRSIAFHSVKKKPNSFPNQRGTLYCGTYTRFQSISQHCSPFLNISPYSVVFHSIKESTICFEHTHELYIVSHYIRFYTKSTKLHLTPQYSKTFYSGPFCQRRIHSFPKQSLTLYCITVYPIPLHSTTFYSIRQYSSTFLCFTFSQRRHHSLPKRTGDLYYVTLQTIPLRSTSLPSIPRHSNTFYFVPFCKGMLHLLPNNSRLRIVSLHMPFLSIPQDSTPFPNSNKFY